MENYFYGWYFKCQSETQTLSIIPAIHRSGQKKSCSIQVITKNHAWSVAYPAAAFHRTGKDIWIGKNQFGERGIHLALHTPELDICGDLRFGALCPLKYDIMGSFSLFPFLECRHSVQSMKHLVCGSMNVNGQEYSFQNAYGYWEGDEGHSFPKEYAWTQCGFPGGSLMLSVADVPIAGVHFRGIISAVLWKGKEYRLATYLGAKTMLAQEGSYLDPMKVIIRKYIQSTTEIYGYFAGATFANQIGLTPQMPAMLEIITSKESTKGRTVTVGSQAIRLKRPATTITSENAALLQLLDAVSQAEKYSELSALETGNLLRNYAKQQNYSKELLINELMNPKCINLYFKRGKVPSGLSTVSKISSSIRDPFSITLV